MPRPTYKTGDVVVVTWEDAAKHSDKRPGSYLCRTVGFLYDLNEKDVTIVQEWFEDGVGRDFNTIPKGMVKGIRRLGRMNDTFPPIIEPE